MLSGVPDRAGKPPGFVDLARTGKWAISGLPARTGKWAGLADRSRTGKWEVTLGLAFAFAPVELLACERGTLGSLAKGFRGETPGTERGKVGLPFRGGFSR